LVYRFSGVKDKKGKVGKGIFHLFLLEKFWILRIPIGIASASLPLRRAIGPAEEGDEETILLSRQVD